MMPMCNCSSGSSAVCDSNVLVNSFQYYIAGGTVTFLLTLLFSLPLNCFPSCYLQVSLILAHPLCLFLPCCPEKTVSVLLDLLFQFITQAPFTMTHASCQSLWPVWEPATAVQSFTYWTMVRGGTSPGSQPLHGHLLVFFFFLTVWQ